MKVSAPSPKANDLSRDELLEQRRELLASIKYASFIQQAILPDEKSLNRFLNEYFTLYLPRDIVSGDFYYCTKVEEFIIVAVGDCTGHGVPGALMSIMGSSFLNEIVSSKGPWRASRILNLLRERVMKVLHQKGKDSENKDAIDMALCIFNEETGELQFAGANNPLYHIRNGVFTEIKGDKMPVGVNAIIEDSFSNNTIQLVTGDMVYIFSDGYADQFGGKDNKKFKYGPMKKLITENAHLDLEEQREILLKQHKDWKREYDQVDDILIFGVKFL